MDFKSDKKLEKPNILIKSESISAHRLFYSSTRSVEAESIVFQIDKKRDVAVNASVESIKF